MANISRPTTSSTLRGIRHLVGHDKLKTFAAGPDVGMTGWIFGVGYDNALLGRHPTREDLDKVSTTVPVMATHISGYFAAVNSLGLKMIGFDASTPNPEGGVIRREADGKTTPVATSSKPVQPTTVSTLPATISTLYRDREDVTTPDAPKTSSSGVTWVGGGTIPVPWISVQSKY